MNAEVNKPEAAASGRTTRRNRARALWAPIVLLELYLATTVFIYFFGPVDWYVPSTSKILVFLFVNYGGLWLGYSWGIRRAKTALRLSHAGDVGVIRMPPRLSWLIMGSMLFTIVFDMVRLYAIRGDLGSFVSSFLTPGEAYRQSQALAQIVRDGGMSPIASFSWAFRVSTLLGVLNGLYYPLTLICWRRLGVVFKAFFFVTLICAIVFTVGLGAQSGLGVLVFASLPVILYKSYVIARPITGRPAKTIVAAKKRRSNRALAKVAVLALVCALVAAVAFFQLDRAEDTGRELNAAKDLGGQYSTPSEHGVIAVTGGRVNYGIVMACMYVSHGYEGLALAMELPFEWTYGLGWSKALQVILHDYLGGPDLFERSYLVRNSQYNDWPNAWWSTIFPWIASDTTYYGTALVMVLIGFVIARCWGDVIITGNPIGFAVLAQMFTLVFMFPANNALAQTLEGLFSLIGVSLIYVVSWRYVASRRNRLRIPAHTGDN